MSHLQDSKSLEILLAAVNQKNESLARMYKKNKKPIVVKISPLTDFPDEPGRLKDITLQQLQDTVDVCIAQKVNGITAVNTTREKCEYIGEP